MFSEGPFFKYLKKCMYKFIERNEERRMGKMKGNKELKRVRGMGENKL